jgi:branched-chain amino acid transport system substrate-binding protein
MKDRGNKRMNLKAISRMIWIVVTACVIVIAGIGAAVYYYITPAKPSTIKIGVVMGLSPPSASWDLDRDKLDAMNLFVDIINKQGGVLGRQIELLVEDDAGDPQKTVACFQKLAKKDIIAWFGTSVSSTNFAIFPDFIKNDGRPWFPFSWADDFNKAHLRNFFHVAPYVSMMAEKQVQFFLDMGWKRTASFVDDNAVNVMLRDKITPMLKSAGVVYVKEYQMSGEVRDFTPYLLELKAAGPIDVLISHHGTSPTLYMLCSQANEVGVAGPGTGVPYFDAAMMCFLESFWNYTGVRGLYTITGTTWHEKAKLSTIGTELAEKFKAKYGRTCNFYMYEQWDALIALTEAIKEAGTTEKEALISKLETGSWVGTRGTIKFPSVIQGPDDLHYHQLDLPVFITQYQKLNQAWASTPIIWPKDYATGELIIP